MNLNAKIFTISECIDSTPANQTRPLEAATWARLAKVSEESGEVISAFISFTGQNPRKPERGPLEDVEGELLDVAITALGALAHLRANDTRFDLLGALEAKADAVLARLQ